jgi:hypothetical protein
MCNREKRKSIKTEYRQIIRYLHFTGVKRWQRQTKANNKQAETQHATYRKLHDVPLCTRVIGLPGKDAKSTVVIHFIKNKDYV